MTGHDRARAPAFAFVLFAAATAVFMASLARALRIEPAPQAAGLGYAFQIASVHAREPQPVGPILAAADKDPFRPDRSRPPRRFRMPGEAPPVRAAAPARPAAPVRLVGTLLSPGGGIAMCQVGAQPTKLVRVGETIEGLTLKAVESGQAVFRSATGASVVIQVAKAGS